MAVGGCVFAAQVQVRQRGQWSGVRKVTSGGRGACLLGLDRAGSAFTAFATVATAITTFAARTALATGLLRRLAFCATGVACVGAFHRSGCSVGVVTIHASVQVARLAVAAATAPFTAFATSVAAPFTAFAFGTALCVPGWTAVCIAGSAAFGRAFATAATAFA